MSAKSQCIENDQNIFGPAEQARHCAGQELTAQVERPYRSCGQKFTMKILILGGGGREHAIVWKCKQSADLEEIWCAPGNGGISLDAECLALDLSDVVATADLAAKLGADLTIVGPEMPLVRGVADQFARRGLTILGPSQKAAQLEGSKIFAKEFMQRHEIPTADVVGLFGEKGEAHGALRSVSWPLVIKADGLCGGKGVLVASTKQEAEEFVEKLFEGGEFGEAGRRVLCEEALAGRELSYIILTDGEKFISLAPTRDHKRAYDDDRGPNTGGMGTYSCGEILSRQLEELIIATIVQPTLAGLRQQSIAYRGFIFFGLMLTSEGPKVLEYNCRLGDPETQSILLRADFDFARACRDAATGKLEVSQAKWSPGASACVVIASEGYPVSPVVGKRINGIEAASQVEGAVLFHSGTKRRGEAYYTTGGRVLGVSAQGQSLAEATARAYQAAREIEIAGSHYRKDIGRSSATRAAAADEASR
jgi:phosphoribosylamine---glycine ligase